MLTLRQYLDQFTRKEHTAELHRLMATIGCTREHIYAMAKGSSASLDMALRTYNATHGRVDPRSLSHKFNWERLDAYYRQEHALAPPATVPAAVARAGRSGVVGKAATRDAERAGRRSSTAGTSKAQRSKAGKVK